MPEHGWRVAEERGRRAAKECWRLAKEAVIADTCVPMFKLPYHCALHCLCCKYKQAGKDASLCVWQCVQFWTPLSLTVLFLWLLYRPDRFHPRVDSAALTTLDLTGDALQYNLAVVLSFRNSNRLLGVRYLDVGAAAFYNGTRLGPADNPLPGSFRQGPKNTTVLHAAFQGTVAGVDTAVAKELGRERGSGTVHVRVSLDLTIMYKVWFVEDVVFHSYDCWLWFNPPPPPTQNAVFHGDDGLCFRV